MVVQFSRLSPADRSGMFNIDCTHPEPWTYHCIGSHHGAQGSRPGDEAALLSLGAAIGRAVRAHYEDLPPTGNPAPHNRRSLTSAALQRGLAVRVDPGADQQMLPKLAAAAAALQADPEDRSAMAMALSALLIHAEQQGVDLLALAAQIAWEEVEEDAGAQTEGVAP